MNTAAFEQSISKEWRSASGDVNNRGSQPFEIYQLEDAQQTNPLLTNSNQRQNRYEILWVKKGNGIIQSGEQVYSIREDMLYCFLPGKTCKYLEGDRILEGYYISFSRDFIQPWQGSEMNGVSELFEEIFHRLIMPVSDDIKHEIDMIADRMRREFNNCFNQKLELLRGLLNIFVIYFSRNSFHEGDVQIFTRDNLLFKNFMSLVKKKFTSMKMVSDYARELCVTANYLNRTVKKISGNTASFHIQQQIVMEAKKQAVHCGSSMKEIAYQLGFDNLAHFSKFFKNNSGTNFTCFKKGIQYTR
jgi:AraC family transcriptional regulator, transcriptional activator of pobA